MARLCLAIYAILLAVVAFWPVPIEKAVVPSFGEEVAAVKRSGAPRWFTYSMMEAAGNVALFIPLGSLLMLSMSRVKWWAAGLLGFAVSTAVELGQLLLLPSRVASFSDVALNTLGAMLGAAIVTVTKRGR